jgi:hypothetical protein
MQPIIAIKTLKHFIIYLTHRLADNQLYNMYIAFILVKLCILLWQWSNYMRENNLYDTNFEIGEKLIFEMSEASLDPGIL